MLADELGLDPGPDLVALEQAILRQDPALVAQAGAARAERDLPVPGLVPYDVADGEAFFGRDDGRGRVPAPAGVERRARGGRAVGQRQVVAGAGRGRRRAASDEGSRVRRGHPRSPPDGRRSTRCHVGAVRPGPVVDQCEEAVTLCDDPDERAAFFAALAAHAERGPLVVALRADRLGEVVRAPRFARLVERGLYLLGAMDADELRAASRVPPTRPACCSSRAWSTCWCARSRASPARCRCCRTRCARPGHREGRTLTVAGYQANRRHPGGGRPQSAEEVYERVAGEQRPLLRDLLLRLVTPSARRRDRSAAGSRAGWSPTTRRTRTIIELLVGPGWSPATTASSSSPTRPGPGLAAAAEWLDDDIEGQRILRHLARRRRRVGHRWAGPTASSTAGSAWLRRSTGGSSRPRASPPSSRSSSLRPHARVDAELRAAREQAAREARAGRRTRRLAVGLAVALVLALVAAGLATLVPAPG